MIWSSVEPVLLIFKPCKLPTYPPISNHTEVSAIELFKKKCLSLVRTQPISRGSTILDLTFFLQIQAQFRRSKLQCPSLAFLGKLINRFTPMARRKFWQFSGLFTTLPDFCPAVCFNVWNNFKCRTLQCSSNIPQVCGEPLDISLQRVDRLHSS